MDDEEVEENRRIAAILANHARHIEIDPEGLLAADDDDSLSMPDTDGNNSAACDDCQRCRDTTGLPSGGSYSLSWLGLLFFSSLFCLRRPPPGTPPGARSFGM